MSTHSRKIKIVQFTLEGNSFECQIKNWKIVNGTGDGERFYAQCADGEFFEDAEPEYSLELEFFSDWRLNGISDYLVTNDQETVAFQLDHHPDVAAEHVRWTGDAKVKAPDVGGEGRTTEMTTVTLPIIGKPVYTRP